MRRTWIGIAPLVLLWAVSGFAQDDWDSVVVTASPVRDNVYMIVGRGGNIGLCTGADGTFIVDDQYAPLTDKIVAAIETVTDDPVRFVVNTHFHGDHTGGNENFGKMGAILIAQENVRRRMSVEQVRTLLRQDSIPAFPVGALPQITYTDEVTFFWNDEEIRAFHVEHAHTDADAIIHFKKADVFHMGDTFFRGRYPFIDIDLGGNVDGVIAAADAVLSMSKATTRIIPGHGDLATPDDLKAYRNMLFSVRFAVRNMIEEGKTLEEILAARPTASFDASISEDSEQFVRSVYFSLTR
jgi:cyclase